jgi:hypothetical protein
LKIHLETTHKLGGSETDAPGGAAAVDWTEDEQRELDRLLDEINAEEDKREKPEEGSSEDLGRDHTEEGTEETG